MKKANFRRLSFDDLLPSDINQENFKLEVDRNGKPKIRKKNQKKAKQYYINESELKKTAIEFLKTLPRCKLLLTDNMGLMIGNKIKVKTRNPGMSDHHLCIRGLFVAIEAKMPGSYLSPDQKQYKLDIIESGGIFILYRSMSDLITELKKYKLITGNYDHLMEQ